MKAVRNREREVIANACVHSLSYRSIGPELLAVVNENEQIGMIGANARAEVLVEEDALVSAVEVAAETTVGREFLNAWNTQLPQHKRRGINDLCTTKTHQG
jgi:hypothetical protein